jgi:hypothetical protein
MHEAGDQRGSGATTSQENGTSRLTQWRCFAPFCASEIWLVEQHPDVPDVWRVASSTDASPWLVAATEPVCPHCGTTLQPATKRHEQTILAPAAAQDM